MRRRWLHLLCVPVLACTPYGIAPATETDASVLPNVALEIESGRLLARLATGGVDQQATFVSGTSSSPRERSGS